MSTLALVRHGQAQAFTDDPDRLSDLGWKQARTLGQYWVDRGRSFSAAFHGTLRRQRETYEAVSEAYREAGADFPVATVLPGLDEYQAQDLVTSLAPEIAANDEAFAPLWDGWRTVEDERDRNRRFQLMFEALVIRWIEGKLEAAGLEPWSSFKGRVNDALRRIRATPGRGLQIVSFTSGGPIGVAVQGCLRAPDRSAVEINWRVRNSSVTSFLYSRGRFSLDGFNETPHLAIKPDLISYR